MCDAEPINTDIFGERNFNVKKWLNESLVINEKEAVEVNKAIKWYASNFK